MSAIKCDIAIIGLGCRFPGANDPNEFWQLLQGGRFAVSTARGSHAGYVADVRGFDPTFFNISPREAARIDPQHRLLLEVAWEAFEDALIPASALAKTNTGVFVGISGSDYARLLLSRNEEVDPRWVTGTALSIAANRLSYFFDFCGPSLAVDTACSSSLVAVHLACQSLMTGECELAIAGGVNLILSEKLTTALSKAGMLAPDGVCRTFDSDASGYVRGEGCGLVVLKRTADALSDRDRIRGVIAGSGINQNGRGNGLTAPSGGAQTSLISEVIRAAGITAAEVTCVEAHGTGTPLGDPIELQALGKVFADSASDIAKVEVGSVKTNFGHLEAAAGIAGLIKMVLALEHEEIPPHLHLRKLNPHVDLEALPLTVTTQRTAWARKAGQRRTAGISSFGFGGTNSHLLVRDSAVAGIETEERARPLHLLTISARNQESLRELSRHYEKQIEADSTINLSALCFSASACRTHFNHRAAMPAQSTEALLQSLRALAEGRREDGLFTGAAPRTTPRACFLFTGQSAQYRGMGRELYDLDPTFRRAFDACSQILGRDLRALTDLDPEHGDREAPLVAQVTLFALEYGLVEMLSSWGVRPYAVLGHSIGEYAAAFSAGALSLETALSLVGARGRHMSSLPRDGLMAAVLTGRPEVTDIARNHPDVAIAAINSSANTVVSGKEAKVRAFLQDVDGRGIDWRVLDGALAFHSAETEPILEDFRKAAQQVSCAAPRIPFVSTLTGKVEATAPDADYWTKQIREPVLFAEAIKSAENLGCTIFLEIGPQPVLTGLARRSVAENQHVFLPTLKRGRSDWKQVLTSLAEFYVAGGTVDWNSFYGSARPQKIALPLYPFIRKAHWIGADEDSTTPPQQSAENRSGIDGSLAGRPAGAKSERDPQRNGWAGQHLAAENASGRKEENLGNSMPRPSAGNVSLPGATRRERIFLKLREHLANLLEMPPEEVDGAAPFAEMGADSIALVYATREVEAMFGVRLRIRQLFEQVSTLNRLAEYLDDIIPADFLWEVARPAIDLSAQSLAAEKTPNAHGPQAAQLNNQSNANKDRFELGDRSRNLDGIPAPAGAAKISFADPRSAASERPKQNEVRTPYRDDAAAYRNERSSLTDNLTATRRFGENQRRYLEDFVPLYNRQTARSKAFAEKYRGKLADSRNSAGFRLPTKELLYPIVGERGKGARVWDIDGNEYVDIAMGFGACLFGHSPPFITRVLSEHLEEGIQIGPQSQIAGEVAELISELTGHDRVRFCLSGSDAVMIALRLARTVTQKSKIVLFNESFHGHYDGTLLIPHSRQSKYESAPGTLGIPAELASNVAVLEYGSPQSLEFISQSANQLAAILVEPVQSRRPGLQPGEFLLALRDIASRAGIPLIFDEVITGFRVHPRGAQGVFGVQADLAIYGKAIGGGMPIGVVAGSRSIMDAIDGGAWSYGDDSYPASDITFSAGTFNKHPLAMAACREVLKQMKVSGPGLQDSLNSLTSQTASRLNRHFAANNYAIRVDNFGSLFRFVHSSNLDLFYYRLLYEGVFVWEGRTCFLSTAHTMQDIEKIHDIVRKSADVIAQAGLMPLTVEPTRQWHLTISADRSRLESGREVTPAPIAQSEVQPKTRKAGESTIAADRNKAEVLPAAKPLIIGAPQDSRWFARPPRKLRGLTRLFCFPYAGGGSWVFRGWSSMFPADIDVCPIELPGRGPRIREQPFNEVPALVEAVYGALQAHLDQPYMLFGHSVGGLIAFELARLIRRRSESPAEPICLFLSGCGAPHLHKADNPPQGWSDEEIVKRLKSLNGTPREVLGNPELMELALPSLRADFLLRDNYSFVADEAFDFPLCVFGGTKDNFVPRQALEAWLEYTRASFSLHLLNGDHFFINSARPLLLNLIRQESTKARNAQPQPGPGLAS